MKFKKWVLEHKSEIILVVLIISSLVLGCLVAIQQDILDIHISIHRPHRNDAPVGLAKPVLYLYPEEETDVEVKLDLGNNGELTTTYPKYNNGWKVKAYPDGKIIANDKEYNYLYWEGLGANQFDRSKGYCVAGEDTEKFLEEKLEYLGLNRKEANEFIVYWLPLMEHNKYNYITFHTDDYAEIAKLDINPKPDTSIRIFMVTEPLDQYIELEEQDLDIGRDREGFTIVEWGGSLVSSNRYN